MGKMVDRRLRELTEDDIQKIAGTYRNWRKADKEYNDIKGFCKSATLDEVRKSEYVLSPGRYVGLEEVEDDGIPFEEKMETLTRELGELFDESHRLEKEVKKNLGGIGYEF